MKIPSRLALALGTLIAGGAALTEEINLSHPVHKAVFLVAGVVLFLLNPQAGAATTPPEAI